MSVFQFWNIQKNQMLWIFLMTMWIFVLGMFPTKNISSTVIVCLW